MVWGQRDSLRGITMEKEEVVEKARSAQVLIDYMRGKNSFAKPFNPSQALNVVRNDPVVSAAIDRKTNKTLEGGWGIKTGSKQQQEATNKKFRRTYRFDTLLRSIIRTGQWQDVLIEVVKTDGEPGEFNLLDAAAIDVETESNGDPKRYYQETSTASGEKSIIEWSPEQVVHIKFKDAILNYWGESDIKVAYDTVLIKDYIRKYLMWLFKTNQFRTHYSIQNASDTQIRNFISRLKEGERTYDKPVITEGEVVASPLRDIKDFDQIIALLEWCDKQLISLMQTTVVAMGWGGSGGRSESDSLSDELRTSIISIQRTVADAINYDLFPRIGMTSNDEFYWFPLDRMTKKGLLETIEIMKRTGWSDEAIQEFAENEGLTFKTTKWFNEPEMIGAGMTPEAKKDGAFSRQRSGEGEADKNVGTGEDSSTREDQLTQKAKYDAYPYVYEVNDDAL